MLILVQLFRDEAYAVIGVIIISIIIIIIIKASFNEKTHLTMSIFHEALKYNIHVFTRQNNAAERWQLNEH